MAAQRLVRAGVLTVDTIKHGKVDDDPRVTEVTRFNLCLDELGIERGKRAVPDPHRRAATKREAG